MAIGWACGRKVRIKGGCWPVGLIARPNCKARGTSAVIAALLCARLGRAVRGVGGCEFREEKRLGKRLGLGLELGLSVGIIYRMGYWVSSNGFGIGSKW